MSNFIAAEALKLMFQFQLGQLQPVQTLAAQNADKDDLQLVAVVEAQQHCMEVDTDDDKGQLEAYNHMEDNTDDDIDQVEEASMSGDNVASAAFPN